ncbi:low-affinity phosphate transporter [Basidiobolus ranarum]|uniref:Low-affinity phosphate transporter n=1 Tax=Basidiobolus ranarum TaxID=34480 RepID=A0ABR2W149_9FUNG
MKFSHSLQFNSVPDWQDYYIAYSNLKKIIYQLEKAATQNGTEPDLESRSLIGDTGRAMNVFTPALDKELSKITAFYTKIEAELYGELHLLIAELEQTERTLFPESSSHVARTTLLSPAPSDPHRVSVIKEQNSKQRQSVVSMSWEDGAPSSAESSSKVEEERSPIFRIWTDKYPEKAQKFRVRIVNLFVQFSELKGFIDLNMTGFRKILKKFDKITDNNLKDTYIGTIVKESYPFHSITKRKISHAIEQLQSMYAAICCNGDMDKAEVELRSHLREHIVWERNTVWRDMMSMERKVEAAGVRQEAVQQVISGRKRRGSVLGVAVPSPGISVNLWAILACLIVFIALINIRLFDTPEQQNCFALLTFVSLLWATEVIPLFVTALIVPMMVVFLRVLRSDDGQFTRLTAQQATQRIFASMFSPVIMLLLGGFSIAAALSKYNIAKMMATWVLSKAGTKPSTVLLANMMVATVASMWISNVAAPVLCFSLIQPILRTLPANSPFARCLIMGIALASNIGGMASPISSPQNIIAIDNMDPHPSWAQWFFITIPICLIGDVAVWGLLLWNYKPPSNTPVNFIRANREPFTRSQIFIIAVTVLTIILWCVESQLADIVGDMGIIAIIPLIVFFGTGLLTKEDFNNFLWTVIILAMGGIALGKAVESSGLLHTIASHIRIIVDGLSPWKILVVFCSLVLVIATFISHTVGALIILPIVASVGNSLPDPRPRLLVMGAALMCSGAMGLPVSGFPNMNAIMLENETGVRYLNTKDFLKNGVPGSCLVMLIVITLGYGLMLLMGY